MDISALMVRSPGPLAPPAAAPMSPPHTAKVAHGPRASAARKRIRKPVGGPKKPRKTRVIHNFTYEQLAQYFHLSQREAGKRLGVSAITMKRNCKRRGIQWPFRANKIQAARMARCDSDSEDEVTSEDDEVTSRTQPSGVMARSNLDIMSEAALLFARLPYLCVDEGKVTLDE
uniref:RWP-RK domain-containing protein n=1 Tax=Globisporangium ultimum (strain ATCC 200006 / CBS 805.95 / DAOM BR144) TaxID=431595 RepID=K3WXP1_GLOUD